MRFTRLLQLQLIADESIRPQDNNPTSETEKACGSFKAGYSIQELIEQNALELFQKKITKFYSNGSFVLTE